jgi:hypothetical protein
MYVSQALVMLVAGVIALVVFEVKSTCSLLISYTEA